VTRRLYESEQDRDRELKAAMRMAHQLQCQTARLPRAYPADWAIVRPDGTLRAIVEIKVRNVTMDRYPTLILSVRKVNECMGMAMRFGFGFMILASYSDVLAYIILTPEKLKDMRVTMLGRTDRDDKGDIEPVVHIPHGMMKVMAW
jgi:hypothetical protein